MFFRFERNRTYGLPVVTTQRPGLRRADAPNITLPLRRRQHAMKRVPGGGRNQMQGRIFGQIGHLAGPNLTLRHRTNLPELGLQGRTGIKNIDITLVPETFGLKQLQGGSGVVVNLGNHRLSVGRQQRHVDWMTRH